MDQGNVLRLPEPSVSEDVALSEFNRFCETMDLDVAEARMDAGDLKSFKEARHILVRAIMAGSLVVDDKGQPVYTPKTAHPALDGGTITFYEPTGASFMSMDTKKREEEVAKTFGIMASMTHLPEHVFSKMPQRDLKVCRTIVMLFLG